MQYGIWFGTERQRDLSLPMVQGFGDEDCGTEFLGMLDSEKLDAQKRSDEGMNARRTLRTKLLIPHRSDCPALGNVRLKTWSTPWFLPHVQRNEVGTIWRDKIGRRIGRGIGEEWLILNCNSHAGCHCPAKMIVALEDILNSVPIGGICQSPSTADTKEEGKA